MAGEPITGPPRWCQPTAVDRRRAGTRAGRELTSIMYALIAFVGVVVARFAAANLIGWIATGRRQLSWVANQARRY